MMRIFQSKEKRFLDAAKNGNLNKVKEYINNGGNKEAKTNNGSTALHYASENGHLNIIKYLIEKCHVDTEVKNNNGWNALHYASYNGHLDTIQCLIESCQVDTEAKSNNGSTALHCACDNGHLDVVKYLIETCQVDTEVKANNGWNALLCASYNGHLNIIKYLIESCQVDTEAKSNNGWTALHLASDNGYLDIVKYLIESCQVDTEVKSNNGWTAYDFAKNNNKNNVVQYLEKARVHSTTTNDNNAESGNASTATNDNMFVIDQLPTNDAATPMQSEGKTLSALGNTDILIQKSDSSNVSSQTYVLNEHWISKLQDENQQLIDKLHQLGNSVQFIDERRDILDLLCVEKCHTVDEQIEQSAILASPLHRDFYLLLQRKLKCMIKSCETLSTGMVGAGSGDFRSFAARTIREKGCNVLRETKIGFFIGNAVQWSKKNLAVVPFIDTVGSVFQLIVSLKDEHDRYLGLARVADFATMVCLHQYGTMSLDSAVEKLARWIVRARCASPSCKFVEETDDFGKFKLLLIKLLADSGDTPAKEQASKAADCAFAHIMKPDKGSILFDVLYGVTFDTGLDEALAASILGIELDDLRGLAVVSSVSTLTLPTTSNSLTVSGPSSVRNAGMRNEQSLDALQASNEYVDMSKVISEQQKMKWDIENLKKNQKPPKPKPDTAWGLMYADVYEEHDIEDVKDILKHHREKALETDRIILELAEHTEDHSALLEFLWENMSRKQKERFKQHQREKSKQREKEEQIQKEDEDESMMQRLQEGERNGWIRTAVVDDDNTNFV